MVDPGGGRVIIYHGISMDLALKNVIETGYPA